MQDAGVGQQTDAGCLGRIDHGTMLRHAAANLAGRNQQQLVSSFEGRNQTGRLIVIGLANLDAARGQIGHFLGIAHDSDDFTGRQFFQQGFDNQSDQVGRMLQ